MTKLDQFTSLMRDATTEEYESVNEYIRSISVDTVVNFYQTEENEKPVAKMVKKQSGFREPMILKVRDTSLTFSVILMNYIVLENKFIFSSKFLISWIF